MPLVDCTTIPSSMMPFSHGGNAVALSCLTIYACGNICPTVRDPNGQTEVTIKSKLPLHATHLVRTAKGEYVVSRSLSDPEMKPAVDAYAKQVTRTRTAAQQFLKDVGVLTGSGKLAKSYGG